MAKGLFGGLKGVDAFGKASNHAHVPWARNLDISRITDDGGRQGEDQDGRILYVLLNCEA